MSISKIAEFFLGNLKKQQYNEPVNVRPDLAELPRNPLADPNKFREKRNKIAELCAKMHNKPTKAD